MAYKFNDKLSFASNFFCAFKRKNLNQIFLKRTILCTKSHQLQVQAAFHAKQRFQKANAYLCSNYTIKFSLSNS